LFPGPVVHADLTPAPALASAHEHRSASWVEVGLFERERFVDPQSRAPQDDDQPAKPPAVQVVTGLAHDGDDLGDRRRIGWVTATFVPRRTPGVKSGHRGRRSPTTGGVDQHLRHDALLEIGSDQRAPSAP
jgi:hypothetical protein